MEEELIVGRRSRGCRGKASKRRSREKWLKKIGAAYAHHGEKRHCGLGATSCAGRSAHRASLAGGAATEDLGSGTLQDLAKRKNIAPRPSECAASALTGAADGAHRGEDAATMAAVTAGDAVVGQRGDGIPYTPAVCVKGENGEEKISEAQTTPTVVLVALVLWWSKGWCVMFGLSLVAAAAAAWWLDRLLHDWLTDGEGDILPLAAVKRLLTGQKKPRLTRQRKAKIEHAWRRVFRLMVERGLAGELAQRRLQVNQLQAQLTGAQKALEQANARLKTETNKLRNSRSRVITEAKERHFQAGRLEGLREALPVERENQELKVLLAQQAQQFNEKLLKFQQQLQELKTVKAPSMVTMAAVVPETEELDLATFLLVGLPVKCWQFRSDYVWDSLRDDIQDRARDLGYNKKSWNCRLRGQQKVQRASEAIDSSIIAYPGHGRKLEPEAGEVGFPY